MAGAFVKISLRQIAGAMKLFFQLLGKLVGLHALK